MSYFVLPIIGIVLVLSHIIYGGYSSESKLRRAQISDFGEIGESHLITASTSSDWYSTQSRGNNIYGSSAVRAFHPMAYPQSLGRWTETGFSSSVRSQCSVAWLLRSTRRNIGDDHLAAAIASLQRESIHPQVMLFAEPRNTIGSLFDDAEVRSAFVRWAEELINT